MDKHYLLMNIPETKQFDFFCGAFFSLNQLNKELLNVHDVDELKTKIREDLFKTRTKLNELMIKDYDAFNTD